MASLRLIRIRRDSRTRHVVDVGVRLVSSDGLEIAQHFTQTYGVPAAVFERALIQAWLSADFGRQLG